MRRSPLPVKLREAGSVRGEELLTRHGAWSRVHAVAVMGSRPPLSLKKLLMEERCTDTVLCHTACNEYL